MANNHDIDFQLGTLTVVRNLADKQPSWNVKDVDDDVYAMRNRLGLQENDTLYADSLRALSELYSKGNSLDSDTTTYLTALGTAAVSKSISGVELKAVDELFDAIASIQSKVKFLAGYIGTSNAQRIVTLIGSTTQVNVGSTTFSAEGAVLNGTDQYINTAETVVKLGTGIGGMGVYYTNLADDGGEQVLIGAGSGSTLEFNINYTGSTDTLEGNYGGAVSVTGSTALPEQKYLHIERRGATDFDLYISGVQAGSATSSASFTSPALAIFAGAMNENGTAGKFSEGSLGLVCLTDGTMTDANVLTLSTAVESFMAKVGRK